MQTTKNLLRKMSFFQLGLFLLLLKCTNAAVVDSFPTKEAATNNDVADDNILTGVKLASPQSSAFKIESIKNSGFVDISEAEEDTNWGEDELVWGSEEFLNRQNTIEIDDTQVLENQEQNQEQKVHQKKILGNFFRLEKMAGVFIFGVVFVLQQVLRIHKLEESVMQSRVHVLDRMQRNLSMEITLRTVLVTIVGAQHV